MNKCIWQPTKTIGDTVSKWWYDISCQDTPLDGFFFNWTPAKNNDTCFFCKRPVQITHTEYDRTYAMNTCTWKVTKTNPGPSAKWWYEIACQQQPLYGFTTPQIKPLCVFCDKTVNVVMQDEHLILEYT